MPNRRPPNASSTRRDFLRNAAAGAMAGAGFWVGGRGAWAAADGGVGPTTSPNERLNVALIGVAGRAAASMDEEDKAIALQNVVAICDVDESSLNRAAERFTKAKAYRDFRKVMDRNDIDAVMVSTPDHTHAAATLMAIESGRHVYCEKPLTHTVEEARRVAEAAAKHKRVTQMGTQIHATANYRRVVELVKSGSVGKVSEVHVYCGKGWAAVDPPAEASPVPATLDYDLWLGPVPARPYYKAYHPASWRSYWAFGNGTLGDMACHYTDLPFWALDLRHPTRVSADGPPVREQGCPDWVAIHWDFPARGELPPVKLHWYDGGKLPPQHADWELPEKLKKLKNGVVFIGDKGMLFADYTNRHLFPEKQFEGFEPPKPTIPDSIGHHREWLAACKANDPTATTCHFGYSGALAETVLLGTVAYRSGKTLEWDAKNLKIANAPEAERFLRTEYRKGWGP